MSAELLRYIKVYLWLTIMCMNVCMGESDALRKTIVHTEIVQQVKFLILISEIHV